MKKISYAWVVLLLAVVSCTTSNVVVEKGIYDEFDLSKYTSYSFMDVDVNNSHNENFKLATNYLKEEIRKQLDSRGMSEDESNAQLKINLGIAVEDKVQTRETNLTTDPFMYTGQRNYTWKSEEVVVNKYKEGTLTVHLVDSQTNKAAWVGVVSKVIPSKQEKKQDAIETAVQEIFDSIDNKN